jgi:hypothetical protein
MFINLETDPCILHSSPCCACVNLPPPIAFGLTSMLGHYLDSHPCSDATRTPTHESSSSNSIQTAAHVRARTLLRLPLTSVLGCSSDSHSRLHSDATWTPAHNPTWSSMSIGATNSRNSTQTSAQASARTSMSYKSEPVPSDPVRTSVPVRIILISTSPNHPTLLRHLCLISSYKFEPVPLDPVRTSILIHVTIRTLAIQLRSDICVSLHLTSSSPCLWGLLGPPSLSMLRVPCGSEPLITIYQCC